VPFLLEALLLKLSLGLTTTEGKANIETLLKNIENSIFSIIQRFADFHHNQFLQEGSKKNNLTEFHHNSASFIF